MLELKGVDEITTKALNYSGVIVVNESIEMTVFSFSLKSSVFKTIVKTSIR